MAPHALEYDRTTVLPGTVAGWGCYARVHGWKNLLRRSRAAGRWKAWWDEHRGAGVS